MTANSIVDGKSLPSVKAQQVLLPLWCVLSAILKYTTVFIAQNYFDGAYAQ